jgi:hypothetical protein
MSSRRPSELDRDAVTCRWPATVYGGSYCVSTFSNALADISQVVDARSALLSNYEVLTLLKELEAEQVGKAKANFLVKKEQSTSDESRVDIMPEEDISENLRTIEYEVLVRPFACDGGNTNTACRSSNTSPEIINPSEDRTKRAFKSSREDCGNLILPRRKNCRWSI